MPRGGAPYLVLEYLEGEDLSDLLLRRGRLPLTEALDLLFQAADGLSVAHQAGVVHRDLKPANLFVIDQGGTPLVKLLDFGIAKADLVDTHAAAATTGESFLGSPLYASPEQLQSSRSVDVRTDLWSLGCVAYEMIAGVTPFQGTTLTGLITAILTAAPAPLQSFGPLPAAAEDALLRCLCKDPEGRPATVSELLSALAPFASEEARVLARRVARRHAAPASRPPLGASAAASGAAASAAPPPVSLLPAASPPAASSPIAAVSSATGRPPMSSDASIAPDTSDASIPVRIPRSWPALAVVGAVCLLLGVVGALGWSGSSGSAVSPPLTSLAASSPRPLASTDPAFSSAPAALSAPPAAPLASAVPSAGVALIPTPRASAGREGRRTSTDSPVIKKAPADPVREPVVQGNGTEDRK